MSIFFLTYVVYLSTDVAAGTVQESEETMHEHEFAGGDHCGAQATPRHSLVVYQVPWRERCVCACVRVCVCIERERERERESNLRCAVLLLYTRCYGESGVCVCVRVCVCIYIYREREREQSALRCSLVVYQVP